MKTTTFARWPCTIARTVDVLGDGWTMLVLREAFYGVTRFDAFIGGLGIARSTLTDRLRGLVDAGLLQRREYQVDPVRHEYVLTDKGRDFFPVMVAMKTWGDAWMNPGDQLPVELSHDGCGHDLRAQVVCVRCGTPVRLEDTHVHTGPGFPERLLTHPAVTARFEPRPPAAPDSRSSSPQPPTG